MRINRILCAGLMMIAMTANAGKLQPHSGQKPAAKENYAAMSTIDKFRPDFVKAHIKEGVTTPSEVIAIWGQPTTKSYSGGREYWLYHREKMGGSGAVGKAKDAADTVDASTSGNRFLGAIGGAINRVSESLGKTETMRDVSGDKVNSSLDFNIENGVVYKFSLY